MLGQDRNYISLYQEVRAAPILVEGFSLRNSDVNKRRVTLALGIWMKYRKYGLKCVSEHDIGQSLVLFHLSISYDGEEMHHIVRKWGEDTFLCTPEHIIRGDLDATAASLVEQWYLPS